MVTIVIPICFVDFFCVCCLINRSKFTSSQFLKDFRTCQKAFLSHFVCHKAKAEEGGKKSKSNQSRLLQYFFLLERESFFFATISKRVRDIHFSFEEQIKGNDFSVKSWRKI